MITVKDLSSIKEAGHPELREMMQEISNGRDPNELKEEQKEGDKNGVQ